MSYPAHEETEFPLRGEHRYTPCKSCHPSGFKGAAQTEASTLCSACHRDVHAGRRGSFCESCHDENGWRIESPVDVHRRTNFPLTGKHAVIPCQECHFQATENAFMSVSTSCDACHLQDYTRTAQISVDHLASGFGLQCMECHETGRFAPAAYRGHDSCFQISVGPHAAIRCAECHTSLQGKRADGSCNTRDAACTDCHTHNESKTNAEHDGVPGYQFKSPKCYSCHRFVTDN